MGYTSGSILVYSGDLVMFWLVIIIVYILVYAIEFVLHAVPYIRAVC